MTLAALCASKYAETMDFSCFKSNIKIILENIDETIELKGIRLSWEERSKKNIYLAAPDFPDVDTLLLEKLAACLSYHNFKPRLPIQENGLASEITIDEELVMYTKDVNLLYECDLLIAVLLYNDPGTYVELGIFKQMKKPTIIYDPYNYCDNMFVKHTPDFLCRTLDEVLAATYLCLNRR